MKDYIRVCEMSFSQREALINHIRGQLATVRKELIELTDKQCRQYVVLNIRNEATRNERSLSSPIPIKREITKVVIEQLNEAERRLSHEMTQVKLNNSRYPFRKIHVEGLLEEQMKTNRY